MACRSDLSPTGQKSRDFLDKLSGRVGLVANPLRSPPRGPSRNRTCRFSPSGSSSKPPHPLSSKSRSTVLLSSLSRFHVRGKCPCTPRSTFKPLRSTRITRFHHYYGLVRLHTMPSGQPCLSRACTDHTQPSENMVGLPSSGVDPLIPCHGLRPRQVRIISHNDNENAAFGLGNSLGDWDDECYGAQYLHLRYGLISLPPCCAVVSYPTRCRVQF